MSPGLWTLVILDAFSVGLIIGIWLSNRRWRGVGDHEYMNTMASGPGLYTVKRQ